MPVSMISNSIMPATEICLADIVTLPFSVNLIALLMRFCKTALSFSSSVLNTGNSAG